MFFLKSKLSFYTVFKILFLSLICIIIIYPMIYMVSVSISDNYYVMRNEVWLLPKGFSTNCYKMVLSSNYILTAYRNTIIYVVTGTLVSLILTTAAAYSLSKRQQMFGYRFFNTVVLITMFFGGGMIPTYLVVRSLGLIDTVWGNGPAGRCEHMESYNNEILFCVLSP